MKRSVEILERKKVRPTANRILVLEALLDTAHPVSLMELDEIIQTMDKSSVFRVLNVFLEADVVHGIEDGSGSLKYEVCQGEDHCSISDMHVHFYCESCQRTFCFESTGIPQVRIPDGFHPRSFNYMIKGVCPKCSGMTAE